jgi:hypothetical protein
MIDQLRTYFEQQIAKVDANLKRQERDLFGNNDVDYGKAQKTYNVFFGTTTIERDGSGFNYETPATIDIYKKIVGKNYLDDFDQIYNKALQISQAIVCPIDRNAYGLLNDVEAVSIEPLEELTNDNTIKMRLQFNIRTDFGF